MGAVAAWLSIRAHAAVRDVKLAPLRAGIPEITLHVGYLYELNAALFYLTASWIWVLAYLWFLRQTDTAVRRSRATVVWPLQGRRLNKRSGD